MSIKNIRNIGILAHIDAGKTTTTERILYYTHYTHRIGEVDEGLATMDWMELEKEKGITITSAAISFTWNDAEINLIDTPGHVDFTIEVERALRILDGAIIIFSGVEGVETQSEKVWNQSEKYKVPKLAYINKLDRVGADYFDVIDQLKESFGDKFLVLQLPIYNDSGEFTGIIDLIKMKAIYFEAKSLGVKYDYTDIPKGQSEQARMYREILMEKLSDLDDTIMELFLDNQYIPEDLIIRTIRVQCINNNLSPIFCGSSFRNIGIQPLMDGIVNYLPNPKESIIPHGIDPKTKENKNFSSDEESPFSGVIFKITIDNSGLPFCYLRVYSGKVSIGDKLYNPNKNTLERINKIYRIYSNKHKEINTAYAGMIVGIKGLKNTSTGETVCSSEDPVLYDSMLFPDPVISIAIEPKYSTDFKKFNDLLCNLQIEDPSLKVSTSKDTGQTLLSGMGELHLEIITSRMERDFKVPVRTGKIQVAYKETITKDIISQGEFNKLIGKETHFCHITSRIYPLKRGEGFEYKNLAENISSDIDEELKQNIKLNIQSGIVGGYPVMDIGFEIQKIKFIEDRFSEIALRGAISHLCINALREADSVLLEPIMDVEISVPKEDVGDVAGSLSSRNGKIISIEQKGSMEIIYAEVALINMFGYSTIIRSLTKGKGTFSMTLKYYDKVERSSQE